MTDPRVERLAAVIIDYSTAVRPGDLVVLEGSSAGAPLLRALHRRVLMRRAPADRIAVDGLAELLLVRGSDAQLEWVNPSRYVEFRTADARIFVDGEVNTRALSGVDPGPAGPRQQGREKLQEIHMTRAAARRAALGVTIYPTTPLRRTRRCRSRSTRTSSTAPASSSSTTRSRPGARSAPS